MGKKSLAKRGPTALPDNRGSGLEEYFADPPLTPQEAAEERDAIYFDGHPFEERIQSCIIRFRSRRRLCEATCAYFNEYLFLGGIDTNPNPFCGQDPGELKKLTPAERRDAVAHDGIHTHLDTDESCNNRFYTGDLENWSIDFAGVVAGFFSSSVVGLTGLETEALDKAVGVIDNFLRYTLQHDVCPEYEEDINNALSICKDAREEWPMIIKAQAAMPGRFNLAASQLFNAYDENDWFTDSSLSPEEAQMVFMASLALTDEKLFSTASNTRIIREFDTTVEIAQIDRPSDDMVHRFKGLSVDGTVGLPPIGTIKVKPAVIEDEWEPVDVENPFKTGFMTLRFNDSILKHLKVGMKMSVRVCQLDINLKFVKTLYQLVPTFYTFLPQSMMRHYKPPRPEERPAPSIHDKVGGEENDERGGDGE